MADKKKKSGAKSVHTPNSEKAAKKADKMSGKTAATEKGVNKAAKAEKKSKKISRFFHDLKVEIKKIVWPTPHTVWKNVGIVVAVIAVVGVCVFGLDEAFTHLLHQFMNVAV